MIPVTGGTRLFLFRGRVDMRKGFDGLSGVVEANFRVGRKKVSFFVARAGL